MPVLEIVFFLLTVLVIAAVVGWLIIRAHANRVRQQSIVIPRSPDGLRERPFV